MVYNSVTSLICKNISHAECQKIAFYDNLFARPWLIITYACVPKCPNLKHFAASLLLMQHSHCAAERQTVCVVPMLTFDTETTVVLLEL